MKPSFHTAPYIAPGFRRPDKGFTLLELLVTIAIAALLMVLAVPAFVSFRQNALL